MIYISTSCIKEKNIIEFLQDQFQISVKTILKT